jgi:hypothetical protein
MVVKAVLRTVWAAKYYIPLVNYAKSNPAQWGESEGVSPQGAREGRSL